MRPYALIWFLLCLPACFGQTTTLRSDVAPVEDPQLHAEAVRLGSQYDAERDVLLNYEPSDPKMKPHGFSGAAVWCQRLGRSKSLWTASPMIFGVQTSAFMSSRLLQVVGAPTVNEFLANSLKLGK